MKIELSIYKDLLIAYKLCDFADPAENYAAHAAVMKNIRRIKARALKQIPLETYLILQKRAQFWAGGKKPPINYADIDWDNIDTSESI